MKKKKEKDERTPSEKMQDEIEPILYDDVDYKIEDYFDEIKDVEKMRKKNE